MHELSIVMSLLDIVSEERARLGGGRIEVVHVRVGQLSSVVPYALRQSFDTAVVGSDIDGAALAIESVPVAIFCDACGVEREPAGQSVRCPACDRPAGRIVRGRELELVALEFADDAHC